MTCIRHAASLMTSIRARLVPVPRAIPNSGSDCDEILAPSCVWQSLSPDSPGPPDHPARKESLTFRFGLSTLVSMMTTDCQVPSSIRPSSTGIVSDGLMNAGSTWSRP